MAHGLFGNYNKPVPCYDTITEISVRLVEYKKIVLLNKLEPHINKIILHAHYAYMRSPR